MLTLNMRLKTYLCTN